MFDAHCHLDFEAFEEDRDAALDRAREAGVKGLVVAGYEPAGWARQRALAARYPEVSVTFGLHPWAAARAADRSTIASLIGQLVILPATIALYRRLVPKRAVA